MAGWEINVIFSRELSCGMFKLIASGEDLN